MPGIVPQSEYYGLPEREASALPPSGAMADILRPTGIPSGMMNRTAKGNLRECTHCKGSLSAEDEEYGECGNCGKHPHGDYEPGSGYRKGREGGKHDPDPEKPWKNQATGEDTPTEHWEKLHTTSPFEVDDYDGRHRARLAVNTRGMDPDDHAYHTELPHGPGPGREWNPDFREYEPSDEDERRQEAVGEDDESGYNWGPEPRHGRGA